LAACDGRSGDRNELRLTAADGSSTTTIGFSLSVLAAAHGPKYVILFRDISPILFLRKQRDDLMQMAALALSDRCTAPAAAGGWRLDDQGAEG
jgi:hypothetical protein